MKNTRGNRYKEGESTSFQIETTKISSVAWCYKEEYACMIFLKHKRYVIIHMFGDTIPGI